jgi:hypothetical protein
VIQEANKFAFRNRCKTPFKEFDNALFRYLFTARPASERYRALADVRFISGWSRTGVNTEPGAGDEVGKI